MSNFYANITVHGADPSDLAAYLRSRGVVAYVSPAVKSAAVVYPEDLSAQEGLAADLSAHFDCPALVVMNYGDTILLYQLYTAGERIDAYVSSPHDDLDTGGDPVPEGDAAILCAAFGMERRVQSVERVLRRPTKPNSDYAMAVNRHGELARALGLPPFAAGTGYRDIEIGELPIGLDPGGLVKTGG